MDQIQRLNVNTEDCLEQLSFLTEELKETIGDKICKNICFTIAQILILSFLKSPKNSCIYRGTQKSCMETGLKFLDLWNKVGDYIFLLFCYIACGNQTSVSHKNSHLKPFKAVPISGMESFTIFVKTKAIQVKSEHTVTDSDYSSGLKRLLICWFHAVQNNNEFSGLHSSIYNQHPMQYFYQTTLLSFTI